MAFKFVDFFLSLFVSHKAQKVLFGKLSQLLKKVIYLIFWNLRDHQLSSHVNPNSEFKCKTCNRLYPKALSLKNHIRKCHGPNSRKLCLLCKKTFYNLKEHQLSFHADPNSEFKCQTCKKLFPSKFHLGRHITRSHKPGYRKACLLCDKTFADNRNLKEHTISLHTSKEYKEQNRYFCLCSSSNPDYTILHILGVTSQIF
jgi:hypothetical protein